MGMRLGCGDGLYEWRSENAQTAPIKADCPLARVDLLTADGSAVDNAAHLLLHAGRILPCDRDVEALRPWQGHALLLSSDTDCLSLWDGDGLVRTARVGVYPQDLALQGDIAAVCGGADGRLHLLALPELLPIADYTLPGMPERISIRGAFAFVLTLQADPEPQTALLRLELRTGCYKELMRFPGLPGAICAAERGIWVGVSEMLACLSPDAARTLAIIEGFGLIRHLDARGSAVLLTDPLEGICAMAAQPPRPTIEVVYRGEMGMAVFTGS